MKKLEKEKKFELQEAFVLWRKVSKGGKEYFNGKDLNGNYVTAFKQENKINEKQPDYRVYYQDEKGNIDNDKECAILWINTSKSDSKYLSGSTNENEKLVGFFGDENKEARPFIRVYFKD